MTAILHCRAFASSETVRRPDVWARNIVGAVQSVLQNIEGHSGENNTPRKKFWRICPSGDAKPLAIYDGFMYRCSIGSKNIQLQSWNKPLLRNWGVTGNPFPNTDNLLPAMTRKACAHAAVSAVAPAARREKRTCRHVEALKTSFQPK